MVDQLKGEIVAPNDKFKLVYIIFYWLGIGTLLPWNMFITVCIRGAQVHSREVKFPGKESGSCTK